MKFLARLRSRGKQRSKLFRYGWKITLVGLIAGAGLALLIFYGAWAASFDMKKVGAMPERTRIYEKADPRALREPDLFRRRLLRCRNGLPGLFWEERVETESS